MGGGWTVIGPDPSPSAIGLILSIPWDQANQKHHFSLSLHQADGAPVRMPTPTHNQPLRIESDFEVGRPPGVAPGTPLDVPLAIQLGPLPLPPGRRYYWQLEIDGETHED